MPSNPLATLERLRLAYGPEAALAKLESLRALRRRRLPSARAVARLHEALCFLRAYPDDAAILALVQAMLERFAARPDLRAQRAALASSGIAGTAIRDRFFAGQAQWLAQRWPAHLRLAREDAGDEERIARALPGLLTPIETQALVELRPAGYAALDRLRGRDETDAVFLLRRIAAMPGSGVTRELFSDALDAGYVLEPGPDTPSRTVARVPGAAVVFCREPPPRRRPDLRAELARAPRRVRRLPTAEAQGVVDLARGAMVTRARSLEAFSFADARDAWWVDDGDGLAFAVIGVLPERRHPLASWYGALTLRNGVPIGYAQSDLVGRSAALSFNTFDTFRGGEAAFVFARWLAALRHLFGATAFHIDPYQLGLHNDEALDSGAWWFYAKLGFAPRDTATLERARAEQARLLRRPGSRTSPATLERLASSHLHFDLDPRAPHPRVPLGELGLQAGAALSMRAGADRERAIADCAAELMQHCGLASLRGFTAHEREAWRRLAVLLPLLGVARWAEHERRALVPVLRAKGGRSERAFVARWLAHPRLDAALQRWATRRSG